MTSYIQKILDLSDEERRKVKIRRRPRRRPRTKRRQYSPEEMLSLLKKNMCSSWRMWAKVRKPDEPTVYEFRKAFGSWRNASLQAFPRVADGIQKDKEYLLKLVLQFDLWTYKDYILAHKSNPEVVPSYKYLRKKWESYRSLVELAKRSSLQKIMERYMVLWRKMGKKPTLEQCKNDGVQIDEAIRLVGSRDKLDELIVLMERQYEKQG